MNINDYSDLGRERIKEIYEQGWSDIEFIEIVFREWVKLNQIKINKEYFNQKGIDRLEGDIDQFSLWLVDNIYLQLYCKGCLLYTSPSPRDMRRSRMPSSA